MHLVNVRHLHTFHEVQRRVHVGGYDLWKRIMVTCLGTRTVRYGTVIMPSVVKGLLGALPQKELVAASSQSKLSFLKGSQFLEEVTHAEGRYPSVSTILGCTTSQHLLYRWQLKMIKQLGGLGAFKKYMRVRVQSGTRYHSCIHRILEEYKNRESFPDDIAEQMTSEVDVPVASYLNSVLPILRMVGKENMELERRTVHHGLCYNGRFDATLNYKDALFLMDWKTASPGSTKDAHLELEKMYNDPLQIAAYIGAVNSDPNFRSLPEIRYGAIVVAHEDGSGADVVELSVSELEVYWKKWLECVRQFWTEMETRPPVNDVISFVWNDDVNATVV